MFWALIAIPAVALAVARIAGFFIPIWAWRYFAPIVAPLLLLGALGSGAGARGRRGRDHLLRGVPGQPGVVRARVQERHAATSPAEMQPLLHPGDLVVVGQPEQAPLAWYYLPAGLRFATTMGPVSEPRVHELDRARWAACKAPIPGRRCGPLVASLKPGQQLLFVRPLTEGVKNWKAAWPELVRRRSAQWGQMLQDERANGTLKPVAIAPAQLPKRMLRGRQRSALRRRPPNARPP